MDAIGERVHLARSAVLALAISVVAIHFATRGLLHRYAALNYIPIEGKAASFR